LTILGLAAGGPGEAEVPGQQQREGDGGAGGEAGLGPVRQDQERGEAGQDQGRGEAGQDQGRAKLLQEAVLNTSHSTLIYIVQVENTQIWSKLDYSISYNLYYFYVRNV
jgi:hypothetical protein